MKKWFIYSLVSLFVISVGLGFQGCSKKQVKKDGEEAGIGDGTGKIEIGDSGGLKIVHFEFDASGLTKEARTILKDNAEWLKGHKNIKVQVEGHCDSRGTQEYNLALGQKRAEAVRKYLADLGVAAKRLSTISYGEEKSLDFSETEEAWTKNRRAQFVITDK
ncbi:MAG: peptidoglycan-associated lipoprotein Pal [Deltaproteobacteria bacterium]|nr:peptidoglycan-associated lipoprotein Pal [Deltaproteobacteria bacterium]